MLEHLFNSPFLTSLSLTLLHFLWQGVLVALVLKSALLIFNNNNPQLRYALSALAMLANALLPVITFSIIYHAEISSENITSSSLAFSDLIQGLKQPDALVHYKELTELLPALLPYLALLWLTTITLLAGKLLAEIYYVNQLPHQGAIAPSNALAQRFNELVQTIHLKVTPQLIISLKVDVPMAIGWLKPVVLLPASMVSGLTSSQLEMLILHELAHIRRHDYLVNFLQTLIDILLFFHPSVQWVSKQMRNEREYCSDDIAVQYCGDAVAYAHTLADTASLCSKKHHLHTIPNMAMAASGGDLKQRVIRLVEHHCAPKNNISKWLASATIIFSVLLLSSKQLLTVGLLDMWHNKNPWQQVHSTQLLANNNQVKTSLPSSSIAQQLLTPIAHPLPLLSKNNLKVTELSVTEPQLAHQQPNTFEQPTNGSIQTLTADTSTSTDQNKITTIKTQAKADKVELDEVAIALQPTQIEQQPLTAPLNDMQTSHSELSMVEQAFERTNSDNTMSSKVNRYAKQIALLDMPNDNTHNAALTKTDFINADFTNEIAETAKLNHFNVYNDDDKLALNSDNLLETTNNTDELSTSRHKNIQPIIPPIISKPIWHSAKQLTSVDPVYPSVAKRKGIEIEVKVDFTIDVDGQIKDIHFASQNKLNYFKNSIRTAIKKWRFLPAKVDDQPVESQMSKVFAFSLQS